MNVERAVGEGENKSAKTLQIKSGIHISVHVSPGRT
jgi:hypothetical protein